MDDPEKPKRGRPKLVEHHGDIDIHARINKDLLDAVKKPNCSLSYTLNRALRHSLERERPNNLKALAVHIRDLKFEMARINKDLAEARQQAKALGVKDLHEFEDSLDAW